MANNIIVQIAGGKKEVYDGLNTIADVRAKLNLTSTYAAALNGDPANDSSLLEDGDMVTLAQAVKGGCY